MSIHGCKDIPTPNIDALGRSSVRCTQGYISAPQCSPTRAGLMTGRYQQRFGHEYNSAVEGSNLSLAEVTLAERLKKADYKTGLVGKWHLGDDEQHHPLSRGFDEFFGFLGGANPYLPQGPRAVVPRIMRGKEPAEEKRFLTQAFAEEAAPFSIAIRKSLSFCIWPSMRRMDRFKRRKTISISSSRSPMRRGGRMPR